MAWCWTIDCSNKQCTDKNGYTESIKQVAYADEHQENEIRTECVRGCGQLGVRCSPTDSLAADALTTIGLCL
jgi:hypothetical protein